MRQRKPGQPRVPMTCSVCGIVWKSSVQQASPMCAQCRFKTRDKWGESHLSPAQVDAILADALLEEIRLPWERRQERRSRR